MPEPYDDRTLKSLWKEDVYFIPKYRVLPYSLMYLYKNYKCTGKLLIKGQQKVLAIRRILTIGAVSSTVHEVEREQWVLTIQVLPTQVWPYAQSI
jgi:hypothetical protein